MKETCKLCPLYTRLHFHLPTQGPEDAPLLLLADAPTANEIGSKKRLSGPSGRYYENLLTSAGIPREGYKLSSLVKCSPKTRKSLDWKSAAECCKEYLKEDLRSVNVILTIGEEAFKNLSGFSKLDKRRGSIYPFGGKYLLGTYSPEELMKKVHGSKEDIRASKIPPPRVIVADMVRAKELVKGEIEWDEEPSYILTPSQSQLTSFLEKLETSDELVSIDIETTYGDPDRVVPKIVAFAYENEVVCVSFEEDLEFIIRAMNSSAPKLFQNGLFDVRVMEGVGIKTHNWTRDTMYAHHLLYSELPHSLAFLQSLYTTVPYHKDMVNLKDKDILEDA